jgi:hypothetical protein
METTFTPDPTPQSPADIFSQSPQTEQKHSYAPIVTKDLLDLFHEQSNNKVELVGPPKFWNLKAYLKEYRTIVLNCGRRSGHTTGALKFTHKFNNPLFIAQNELALNTAKALNLHKGDIIQANGVETHIKTKREIDLFVIDNASSYPSLDLLYDAFLYAGVGENTFILFIG